MQFHRKATVVFHSAPLKPGKTLYNFVAYDAPTAGGANTWYLVRVWPERISKNSDGSYACDIGKRVGKGFRVASAPTPEYGIFQCAVAGFAIGIVASRVLHLLVKFAYSA